MRMSHVANVQANSMPRAMPSATRPHLACPRPGTNSDASAARCGSGIGRDEDRSSNNIEKGVAHTSHRSFDIGFENPHAGQGHPTFGSSTDLAGVGAAH